MILGEYGFQSHFLNHPEVISFQRTIIVEFLGWEIKLWAFSSFLEKSLALFSSLFDDESHWQKPKTSISFWGLVIILSLFGVILGLNSPNTLKIGLALLVCIVGYLIISRLNHHYAYTMAKTFNINYDLMVEVVHRVLKDKNIRFDQAKEEEFESYKILGLTITVKPNTLNNLWLAVEESTIVTFHGLNQNNKVLANELAQVIYETTNEVWRDTKFSCLRGVQINQNMKECNEKWKHLFPPLSSKSQSPGK